MTDTEAETLGKRLVVCKGFRPMRGMLDMQGRTWDQSLLWRWNSAVDVPDLRDPATLGCVLAMVREAWKDYEIYAAPVEYGYPDEVSPWWHVWNSSSEQHGPGAAIEAEALVAALEAAP